MDTNILIDMLNNRDDIHWNLFSSENIVLCGIVIAELYRGTRNSSERRAVELLVNSLGFISLDVENNGKDWIEIGLFIAEMRQAGLSVPFQDAIIAYLALKHKCILCTNDKHFQLIKSVRADLQLLPD